MYIPPGILAVLITIALTGMISLVAYLFKQVTRHAEYMAVLKVRVDRQTKDLDEIFAWRNRYFGVPVPARGEADGTPS